MKFKTLALNFFFEPTDKRSDERTNGWTSRKQYAPHFFKVGGIKIRISYFLTRNPFMKFQNPSLNFF